MVYRHFKGGRYRILHKVLHSEDKSFQLVYMSLDDGTFWVRPAAMWDEETDRWPDSVVRSRFVPEVELPKEVLEHFKAVAHG